MKARRRPHRERLAAREGNQAPELGKLLWGNRDGEREYQPIERQCRIASGNVDADTMMNAADNGMKSTAARDGEGGCERRRFSGGDAPPSRTRPQHRWIEGDGP